MSTPRAEARALVMTEVGRLEAQTFPLPPVANDDGILRVEATGICGSDYSQFRGHLAGVGAVTPVIPGHEVVGRVEAAGPGALARWGVDVGDLVVLHEVVHAADGMLVYGITVRTTTPPGLWGGYATHVYLHPNAVLHRVPDGVTAEEAALFVPIANGVRWAGTIPGTRAGDTVVVCGPGQQGLGCVVGALHAGAGLVLVTGRAADAHRLEIARSLGAQHTITVDEVDPVGVVMELTGGRGADVVVDASASSTEPIVQACEMVRAGGTVILGGLKGGAAVPGLISDRIVLRQLRLQGVGGHDGASVEAALDLIASHSFPLHLMRTHTLPLAAAEKAVRMVGREVPGEEPIHVTLVP
jgi:threonine dehydrogenase-like Zn-dependent dehydrogenase